MQRRSLMIAAATAAAASAMFLSACTTNTGASMSTAERQAQIDKGINTTMTTLYSSVTGSRELAANARGILVFPSIVSAGFIIGGESGEGALRVGGATTGYYRTTGVSFGLQAGAQSRSLVMMFMTQEALNNFKASSGWVAGTDATVAIARVGANGVLDTATASQSVIAFPLANAGLMAGVTINGSRITRLEN
jgi:lipid-binding SYLF domain-containing protein